VVNSTECFATGLPTITPDVFFDAASTASRAAAIDLAASVERGVARLVA
jgi:hypothetical protein